MPANAPAAKGEAKRTGLREVQMLSLQHCKMERGKLLTYVIGATVGFAASLCLYGQSSAEDDLEQRLNRQCGQAEIAGLIAECLIAWEREYGKQLDQVYRQALIPAGRNAALLRDQERD